MTDDRISAYLHDRAAAIELPPSTSESAVRRARRRRTVRRGTALAVALVTLGASTVLVTRDGGGSEGLSMANSAVTASPLEWSLVESASGLGTLRQVDLTSTDDGAVYSLSTAPGVPTQDAAPRPQTLYRSDDGGAEWAPAELPADFWPASLASEGGRLYAVGTSPAGGGVEHRLATSDDGGATWSSTDVPAEIAALVERYPSEAWASQPSVAVHGGTVVVSSSVSMTLDAARRIPGLGPDEGFRIADEGVVVAPWDCGEESHSWSSPPTSAPGDGGPSQPEAPVAGSPTSTAAGDTPAGATTTTAPPDAEVAADAKVAAETAVAGSRSPCVPDEAAEPRTYTWDELGIDDELRELVLAGGRTFVAVSHDGGEFTTVDVPAAAGPVSRVVASDEGFTLFVTQSSPDAFATHVLTSADGTTWEAATELPGLADSAGAVGGRPAAALSDARGNTTVQVAQPDGSWLAVDPTDVLGEADDMGTGSVAFGPLGWAVTVWSESDGDGRTYEVVHSLDGTTMSLVPLGDVLDVPERASIEPMVSADAVLVRVSDLDDDPTTVSPQRVVVGTPAG